MSGKIRPLKVAHVVRRFAFEEWGGTETVVWNSARHLRAYGVEYGDTDTMFSNPADERTRAYLTGKMG